jgi:uncharacterized membrane protein
MNRQRIFAWIGVAGALWGLVFAGISSLDYASHLDRGLHDLHCSFIPGADVSVSAEGCRTALNSPYSALFKRAIWGGIPISLFALGCFCFLLGYAVSIALARRPVGRSGGMLYGLLAITPLLVSAVMFSISVFELGTICKTCAGIYIASLALGVSAIGVAAASWSERVPLSFGSFAAGALIASAMLLWVLAPSIVYAALAPDHEPLVSQCGRIKVDKEAHDALLKLPGRLPVKHAVFFEDPLCPTCKSLHERLRDAQVLERLDIELALFPLDSDCNWMLDQPLHPGACKVSRAVLCADSPAAMLEWAYANQPALADAARAGGKTLDQFIAGRWGAGVTRCMAERATQQRLNRHLHYAVQNGIAVSTPQIFIEGQRLCDEDIDMGLMFALHTLAPELLP